MTKIREVLKFKLLSSVGRKLVPILGILLLLAPILAQSEPVLAASRPGLSNVAVWNITSTAATLNYTIADGGQSCHVLIGYGHAEVVMWGSEPQSLVYYRNTPEPGKFDQWDFVIDVGMKSSGSYQQELTGLWRGNPYIYYGIYIYNSAGSDGVFPWSGSCRFDTSTSLVPGGYTDSASVVTETSSYLGGYINYIGSNGTMCFDYGTSTSYSNTTGVQNVTGPGSYVEQISGLSPATTYHYRLRATNNVSEVAFADQEFTTEDISEQGYVAVSTGTITMPQQRNGLYAEGRYWLFYLQGNGVYYVSSLDGAVWSVPKATGLGADERAAAVAFDGTYIHLVSGRRDCPLYYRKGKPDNDGTISWLGDLQEALPAHVDSLWTTATITIDANGYPWVLAGICSLDSDSMKLVISASSTNDGTWTARSGFPTDPDSLFGHFYQRGVLVALDNGDMYAISAKRANNSGAKDNLWEAGGGTTLKGCLWNGTSWGSVENVSTTIMQWVGDASESPHMLVSAVGYGNDVCLVFTNTIMSTAPDAAHNIVFLNRTFNAGWGAEQVIQSDVNELTAPIISVDKGSGNLYCFWGGSPDAHTVYYKERVGTTWDAQPTAWKFEGLLDGSGRGDSGLFGIQSWPNALEGKVGVCYGVGYGIRFDYLATGFSVHTGQPTDFHVSTATLNGAVVDDDGEEASVRFQYGMTTDYGANTSWQSYYGTGDSFSQSVSGLSAGTTYHVRAQAKHADGTIVSGADLSFDAGMTLKQSLISGSFTPSSANVKYVNLEGSSAAQTVSWMGSLVSTAGVLSELRVKVDSAPGDGRSLTFTVCVAGTGTDLTCTISGNDTEASCLNAEASVAPGDYYAYLKVEPSGTPTVSVTHFSLCFEPDTVGESLLLAKVTTIFPSDGTRYFSIVGVSGTGSSEQAREIVASTAGVLRNLMIRLIEAPGTNASRIFTLRKNEVSQSLNCTISGGDVLAGDLDEGHAVHVSAGDRICIMEEPVNSPSATGSSFCLSALTFVADTEGESLLGGNTAGTSLSTSSVSYSYVNGGVSSPSETELLQLSGSCVMKNFYVLLSGSPRSGKSYTGVVQVNGLDTDLSVTISGSAASGSDTADSIAVGAGDTVGVKWTPSGTPTACYVMYGFTELVAQELFVVSSAADGITTTRATVYADVPSTGALIITLRGFQWGMSSGNYTYSWNETGDYGKGAFSYVVRDLLPSVKVYWRPFAVNSAGTAYGDELSFTTQDPEAPTVTSSAANTANIPVITLYGAVTDNGGINVTIVGFQWDTDGGSPYAHSWSDSYATDTFSHDFAGVPCGTKIYWRAFAVNGEGTAYSSERSFTVVLPDLVGGQFCGRVSCGLTYLNGKIANKIYSIRYIAIDIENVTGNLIAAYDDGGYTCGATIDLWRYGQDPDIDIPWQTFNLTGQVGNAIFYRQSPYIYLFGTNNFTAVTVVGRIKLNRDLSAQSLAGTITVNIQDMRARGNINIKFKVNPIG